MPHGIGPSRDVFVSAAGRPSRGRGAQAAASTASAPATTATPSAPWRRWGACGLCARRRGCRRPPSRHRAPVRSRPAGGRRIGIGASPRVRARGEHRHPSPTRRCRTPSAGSGLTQAWSGSSRLRPGLSNIALEPTRPTVSCDHVAEARGSVRALCRSGEALSASQETSSCTDQC